MMSSIRSPGLMMFAKRRRGTRRFVAARKSCLWNACLVAVSRPALVSALHPDFTTGRGYRRPGRLKWKQLQRPVRVRAGAAESIWNAAKPAGWKICSGRPIRPCRSIRFRSYLSMRRRGCWRRSRAPVPPACDCRRRIAKCALPQTSDCAAARPNPFGARPRSRQRIAPEKIAPVIPSASRALVRR